jgi:hypothetical protein
VELGLHVDSLFCVGEVCAGERGEDQPL